MSLPRIVDQRSTDYEETSHKFYIKTKDGLRAQVYYTKNQTKTSLGYKVYPAGDKLYGIIGFIIYKLHEEGHIPLIHEVGSPSKDLSR